MKYKERLKKKSYSMEIIQKGKERIRLSKQKTSKAAIKGKFFSKVILM